MLSYPHLRHHYSKYSQSPVLIELSPSTELLPKSLTSFITTALIDLFGLLGLLTIP